MKKALITGITGQDGSYLAEFLLSQGYQVHGIVRRSSIISTERIDHIYQDPHDPERKLFLHYGDLEDANSLTTILQEAQPDEVYNLGAQSHVRVSFDMPEFTQNVVALGNLRLLERMRKACKDARFYQASSSEMFGKAQPPQSERTIFEPQSPYAVGKVAAFFNTQLYRRAYGLHASNGILFNHESPRRGETFVTRKITKAVARIKEDVQDVLYLGNLNAKRDWGHARDYVEVMWLILQQEKPDDFVIATGESYSVRDFLEKTFEVAGIPVESNGKKGVDEVYTRTDTGAVAVRIDPKYFRPTEVDFLLGDPTKAKTILGWEPRTNFEALVQEMYEADHKIVREKLYGTRGA